MYVGLGLSPRGRGNRTWRYVEVRGGTWAWVYPRVGGGQLWDLGSTVGS